MDGNDVLAVYAAAREAADRAREKKSPIMIECVTYRMSLHTTDDDPSRYRSQEEVKAWEKKDPISRLQTYLTGKDILSKKDLDSLREEISGHGNERGGRGCGYNYSSASNAFRNPL